MEMDWGHPQGGGGMRNRKFFAGLALSAVLALVAAACTGGGGEKQATPTGGGGAQADQCKTDKFGCVTVKAGDPIHFGAILTITGATATLGQPTVNGVNLG